MICKKSFVAKRLKSRSVTGFSQFHHLVTGEVNRKNILELKQISRKTLSVKFKVFFDKSVSPKEVWRVLPPTLTKVSKEKPLGNHDPWVLGIDGTWLHRNGVVMIYRDVTHGENLFWSYHASESYQALHDDLEALIDLLGNNLPSGVISDWKGSIVNGVANHFDHLPHQRCLIHVLREVKRWLPKRTPFLFTQELRKIALSLTNIKTQKEATEWKAKLIKWEKAYGHLLKEKTVNPNIGQNEGSKPAKRWWYTHGNLRRGWHLLTDNWYPFFIHLDHPLIPKDNNSLEGVNSQAKRNLGNHRGMKTPQQVSFLFWYLSFTRTKTKQDIKKLWDEWKR